MKASKVTIGLSNPKSPSNVGAVMRAAGCFGVDGIFYTGKRYPRAAQFSTDTKNVSQNMLLTSVNGLLDNIAEHTQVICVELVEGATPLPAYQHPDNAYYIFGPEDGTIEQQIVNKADAVVYVPTIGCMNLAATVNVVLYDRLAKSGLAIDHDALIRQSRDTNNNMIISTANKN